MLLRHRPLRSGRRPARRSGPGLRARTSSARRAVAPLVGVVALSLLASCGGGGGSGGAAAVGDAGSSPDGSAGAAKTIVCEPTPPDTFTVSLPLIRGPGQPYKKKGWDQPFLHGRELDSPAPDVWPSTSGAVDDVIEVPNGRPIYALIVSGYANNESLDELMVYNFATHLMEQGAYVHYAWWNNLLAPYMERPLHHPDSYPGEIDHDMTTFGSLDGCFLGCFSQHEGVNEKAFPAEDFQFVADAQRFLRAIRENNPNAMIVVVGHSMGGGAIVHLVSEPEVVILPDGSTTDTGVPIDVAIDILAPLDPVNNRTYPWGGRVPTDSGLVFPYEDFNWNRWRVTRDDFKGFQDTSVFTGCEGYGDYFPSVEDVSGCGLDWDHAPPLKLGGNIINLHHRWQNEAKFPFDYNEDYTFGTTYVPGGMPIQAPVELKESTSFIDCLSVGTPNPDPGGWPYVCEPAFGNPLSDYDSQCCPSGPGIVWNADGHAEIVGWRGPTEYLTDALWQPIMPVPLGVRLRTSPRCGNCPGLDWPARTLQIKDDPTHSSDGLVDWSDVASAARVLLMKDLEVRAGELDGPGQPEWAHRPTNPDLCLVSSGLINLFTIMNRPPIADAGGDQAVECTGGGSADVVLDGTGTTDPDEADELSYLWSWAGGSAAGEVAMVNLPLGTHCVTLRVQDPSGHYDEDIVKIEVADTTPPDLTVDLSPTILWPPNHKLVDIVALVQAEDGCGAVADLTLVSITSSDDDDGLGDGKTSDDIQGAEMDSLDTAFQLRAEHSGLTGERVYTVTYQATDEAGNRAEVSAEVWVKNPNKP